MKNKVDKFEEFINHQEYLTIVSNYIALIGSGIIAILTILNHNSDFIRIIQLTIKNDKPNIDIVWSNIVSILTVFSGFIIFAFALLSTFIQSKKQNFHIEALQYRETIEKLNQAKNYINEIIKYIGPINLSLLVINQIFGEIRKLNKHSEQEIKAKFKTYLDKIITDILFNKLKIILGRSPEELFTIAIYLFNPASGELEDYSSFKDPLMDKEGPGRNWEIKDGHVGLAYDRKEIIIHSNISEQLSPPAKRRDNDDDLWYVSAITIPIFTNKLEDKVDFDKDIPEEKKLVPRGVFCVTSNFRGCFENTEDQDYIKNTIFLIKQNFILLISKIIQDLFNNIFGDDLSMPFGDQNTDGDKIYR